MRSFVLAILAVGLTAPAGCTTYSSHVAVEDAALGRVVVYRNGIAYYERVAEVKDGRLTLTVPGDKVDDFLKSLTVKDRRTGRTLPVSFPTTGATRDGKVDMTVQVPGAGVQEVLLTYITESPAWKPSYRVMLDGDEVNVQGWAIVDNTSGETWDNVRVGVGSSSALSFRYDLRSVRLVHRETLDSEDRFALAPPVGRSTHTEQRDEGRVVAAFDGDAIPAGAPAPVGDDLDYAPDMEIAGGVGTQSAGRGGMSHPRHGAATPRPASREPRAAAEAPQRGRTSAAPPSTRSPAPRDAAQERATMDAARIQALAARLNQSAGQVVVEGYAAAGERDPQGVSSDRANWLRNELIAAGVAPARLEVAARGHVAGREAGVRLIERAGGEVAQGAADGDPVGESHFQSEVPLTVERGTSAMIAILDAAADGSVVYLYDAESARGNERHAFKAVRFRNPTDSTLETGPMTVYGDGRFIGEGLAEPIPPRATAIVPFALDRQVVVERDGRSGDRIARLITLQRGLLRAEVEHTRHTRLKITSLLHVPTEVFVRHVVRKGWDLVESPDLFERQGEAHLFQVSLAAGETRELEIVEATPMTRAIDIRGPEGVELVRLYLQGDRVDERFAEPMRELLAIHREMADIQQAILATRERVDEFRARMVELERQVVSLDGVRGGGQLLRHLQGRLRETSDRVQEGTIEIVNLQERLMLARIRFQDGVAELSFEPRVRQAEAPQGASR